MEYARKKMDDAEKNATMQQRFEKLEKEIDELRALHVAELPTPTPASDEPPTAPSLLDQLFNTFKTQK